MATKRSASNFDLPIRKKAHVGCAHVNAAHVQTLPVETADADMSEAAAITSGMRSMFSKFHPPRTRAVGEDVHILRSSLRLKALYCPPN